MPAILLPGHGVLCFSDNQENLEAAIVVEEIADRIQYNDVKSRKVNNKFDSVLFEKHYERKMESINTMDNNYGEKTYRQY